MRLVKVNELSAGEKFTSMDGGHYTILAREHVGAVFVAYRDKRKGETSFARSADVERGWNDEGWGAKRRREREADASSEGGGG